MYLYYKYVFFKLFLSYFFHMDYRYIILKLIVISDFEKSSYKYLLLNTRYYSAST